MRTWLLLPQPGQQRAPGPRLRQIRSALLLEALLENSGDFVGNLLGPGLTNDVVARRLLERTQERVMTELPRTLTQRHHDFLLSQGLSTG